VTVIERAPQAGGLAAGFKHGPFTLDFGPHRLHQEIDAEVLADLRELLGPRLERKRRHGRLRLNGRYLKYPVGPATVLGLGPRTGLPLLLGALTAKRGGPSTDSFEEAVVASLGEPFYRLFYGPYAEKAWGLPGSQIAADQADRRVNQKGLGDLARAALGRGIGRYYYYPTGGFGEIPGAYLRTLQQRPNVTVECGTSVDEVAPQTGGLVKLRTLTSSGSQEREFDRLVWSAPVQHLPSLMRPAPPEPVLRAATSLASRAVVLAYAVVPRDRVGSADTYYFPERQFPFSRVIEQKNFSAAMGPPNQTVLGMDLACDPDDATFNASDAELRGLVEPALTAAGLVRPGEITEVFSRRFREAYPLYTRDYGPRLQEVLSWVLSVPNVWLIGRQGLHLHNNTHHSLLMGYRVADHLLGDDRTQWPERLAEFARFRVAD
jgi:protoporphyrinogen oxidase